MKKLTIKDFISNLSPCFSCGEKSNIFFVYQLNSLPTQIKNNKLTCEIAVYYSKKLYLTINLTTSEIETNYPEFLKEKSIIQAQCSNCHSYTQSSILQYKFERVLPVTVQSQYLVFLNPRYHVHSMARIKETNVYLEGKHLLKLPLTTSVNFKNSEQMIKKINLLLPLK